MVRITIEQQNPKRYMYGYSVYDNYISVSNWQDSNILTVPDNSMYYFFVKHRISGKIKKKVAYATCGTECRLIIGEIKKVVKSCKLVIGQIKKIGNGFLSDNIISEQFTGTSNILVSLPKPILTGSITDTKYMKIDEIANGISCYSDSVLLKNGDSFRSDKSFVMNIDSSLLSNSSFVYCKVQSILSNGGTNYATIKGKLTKATSQSGALTIVKTFETGLEGDSSYVVDSQYFWYNPIYNESWSQMTVSIVPNQFKIQIVIDQRGWGTGNGTQFFKVDVDPHWYTKSEIEAIDFSNMKGRTISIFGINRDMSTNHIMDTRQAFVHFKGDSTTNLPSWFKQNPSTRIGTPSYFPNFSLPSKKLNINNYGSLTSDFQFEGKQYLSKGYNFVTRKGDSTIPEDKLMHSDYDQWLYYDSNGVRTSCPISDGQNNRQSEVVAWIASQTMPRLLQLFLPVIYGATGHSVIFYDAEAWGYVILGNQVALNKLATLYREMQRINPNIKQTSYINAKPVQCSFDTNITQGQMLIENNKYNQTKAELAVGMYARNVSFYNLTTNADTFTGEAPVNFGDIMGIGICGDYLHRYNESSYYAFIQEMELSKKLYPNLTMLSLWWSYIETFQSSDPVDINTVARFYMKTNGFWYKSDYKVAVPFSEFYNRLMGAAYFVEGTWIWHDPNNAVNSFDYHGGNGKDVREGTPLEPEVKWNNYPYLGDFFPNRVVSVENLGTVEISSTIGHDWGQLALYECSTNSDIITESVKYCSFSIDGGNTFIDGENLKPASCEFYQTPLVRKKKHPNENTWLIFAINKYLQAHQTQTIKVFIEEVNKTVDITLNGKFATLNRVKLN